MRPEPDDEPTANTRASKTPAARTEHTTDPEAAAELSRMEREARERVRRSVADAADLVVAAREEADRMVEEMLAAASAESDRLVRERLAEADRLAAERLLEAERRTRAMLAHASEVALTEDEATATHELEAGDAHDGVEPAAHDLRPDPPTPLPTGRARTRMWVRVLKVVLIVVVSVIGADLVRSCVAEPYTVDSNSMEPRLTDGERVVVDKLAYRLGDVGRGDVVVLDTADLPEDARRAGGSLVKRVIGLPGDVLEATDGTVVLNGEPLVEPWLHDVLTPSFGPVTVPSGTVFVLGDNRLVSIDSRTFGPVTTDAVIGRVDAVIWPLGDAGLL